MEKGRCLQLIPSLQNTDEYIVGMILHINFLLLILWILKDLRQFGLCRHLLGVPLSERNGQNPSPLKNQFQQFIIAILTDVMEAVHLFIITSLQKHQLDVFFDYLFGILVEMLQKLIPVIRVGELYLVDGEWLPIFIDLSLV